MVLDNNQIDKLKTVELDILKEFIRVCHENNLEYFLIGGTLLGAVRHQGFIPWDDDIDVCMPRCDYETFLEIARSKLPSHLFVQSYKTDPQYVHNFAKLRNSNTTFIESTVNRLKINHGIFIDIFPLDNYPDSEIAHRLFQIRKKLLTLRINECFNAQEWKTNLPKKVLKKLLTRFLTLIYTKPSMAVNKRELLYTRYRGRQTTKIANNSGAWGVKEIFERDWFSYHQEKEFEGLKVYVPGQYDKCLQKIYGDYMKLPPVEKRVPHHDVDMIDFQKSYKEYIQ